MRTYRLLGIILGLLGVGCDDTGAMGAMGEPGATGAQGPIGAMGVQGIQGEPGDSRVTLEQATCNTTAGAFSCEVVCEGVGAIAISQAGWSATPDQGSTLYITGQGQDAVDVGTWNFNFGTEGVAVGVPITMSVVCFTPPD